MSYPPVAIWLPCMLAGFSLVGNSGCSTSDPQSSETAARLRRVAHVYLDFAAAKGTGPANEQQLRAHAANVPLFEVVGVDPLARDQPLVSPRDGEPLLIRYGVAISTALDGPAPIIVCESQGQDDYRLVAFANGKVECIGEARMKELLEEAGLAHGQSFSALPIVAGR